MYVCVYVCVCVCVCVCYLFCKLIAIQHYFYSSIIFLYLIQILNYVCVCVIVCARTGMGMGVIL